MDKNSPKKWRRRLGKKDGKKLRRFLTVMLALECLYCLYLFGQPPAIIQQEHRWQREWMLPPAGTGEAGSDIYGVWLDLETWRLQFYHIRQSINGH